MALDKGSTGLAVSLSSASMKLDVDQQAQECRNEFCSVLHNTERGDHFLEYLHTGCICLSSTFTATG